MDIMNKKDRDLIEKKWFELEEKDKEKLREIFLKLDPIDEEYYIIKSKHNQKALYYIERYCAKIKFEKKIEDIFSDRIYELDAQKVLNIWYTSKEGNNLIRRSVKKRIINNLQKMAKENGKTITEKDVEYYLKLLVACKERQNKVLNLNMGMDDTFINYVFQKDEKYFKEMEKRYDILEWLLKKILLESKMHSEFCFWHEVAIYFTAIWKEEGRKELKKIIEWRKE